MIAPLVVALGRWSPATRAWMRVPASTSPGRRRPSRARSARPPRGARARRRTGPVDAVGGGDGRLAGRAADLERIRDHRLPAGPQPRGRQLVGVRPTGDRQRAATTARRALRSHGGGARIRAADLRGDLALPGAVVADGRPVLRAAARQAVGPHLPVPATRRQRSSCCRRCSAARCAACAGCRCGSCSAGSRRSRARSCMWSSQLLRGTYVAGTSVLDPLWVIGLAAIATGGLLAARDPEDAPEVERPSHMGVVLPAGCSGCCSWRCCSRRSPEDRATPRQSWCSACCAREPR